MDIDELLSANLLEPELEELVVPAASLFDEEGSELDELRVLDPEVELADKITPVGAEVSAIYHGLLSDASRAYDKSFTETVTVESKNVGEPVFIKLALGEVHKLYQVTIHTQYFTDWPDQQSWCVHSMSHYRECIDKRSDVNIDVYEGSVLKGSCGTLELNYGIGAGDQIYKFDCEIEGDTLVLSKASGFITVAEVVVQIKGKLFEYIVG